MIIAFSCFHCPDDVLPYSGSGKTYTMKPLPIRAVEDLMRLLRQPVYSNQKFKLWLSYFEIYGGKLFDLLSERKLVFFIFLLAYTLTRHILASDCCFDVIKLSGPQKDVIKL